MQLLDEFRHSVGMPLYRYFQNIIEPLTALVCSVWTPIHDVLSQEVYNSKLHMQQTLQYQTFYA